MVCIVGAPAVAFAQIPYDPPSAVRPPPNVMVLMDATRTTLIDGNGRDMSGNCTSSCHDEGETPNPRGHNDMTDYLNGLTRLQLARRVLTGGWGWNPSGPAPAGANAATSLEGVMDQYKVNWGVAYYDGIGTRIVKDPDDNNVASQKAVIDFGHVPAPSAAWYTHPDNTEQMGRGIDCTDTTVPFNDCVVPVNSQVSLHSFLPFHRTTNCCANNNATNSSTAAAQYRARQARALYDIARYWDPTAAAPVFPETVIPRPRFAPVAPSDPNGPPAIIRLPGSLGHDENLIPNDASNVLTSAPPAGCRRNFTIMLTDGHGGRAYNIQNDGQSCDVPAPLPPFCITNDDAAALIYNQQGPGGDLCTQRDGNGDCTGTERSDQLFVIHFGVLDDVANSNRMADYGWDGKAGGPGINEAFLGAPGGNITDLSPFIAAFSAVMGFVVGGRDYVGATPSVTRFGEFLISSSFGIRDCSGLNPSQCNIGRPGELRMQPIVAGVLGPAAWLAGANLTARDHVTRDLITGFPSTSISPSDDNCSTWATCCAVLGTCPDAAEMTTIPDPTLTNPRPSPVATVNTTGWGALALEWNDVSFLRGDPASQFSNGVFRGSSCDKDDIAGTCCVDTDGDGFPGGTLTASTGLYTMACMNDRTKLADIANSRPVVVGAPSGIGEDIERWTRFLDVSLPRDGSILPDFGGTSQVRNRDEVVFVGGNDGFLHAFLSREFDTAETNPARVASYRTIAGSCGNGRGRCGGSELWAYSPKLLQDNWPLIQSGHFFMVDGTPVVSDVLFTKNDPTPETLVANYCNEHDVPTTADCDDWEYRTALVQCLGAGGPGCFAMDVTNPYDPQLLWERDFSNQTATIRAASTSRPQIIRSRRVVLDNSVSPSVQRSIPYYVAVMGGGLNEVNATNPSERVGSVVAVGVEDGQYYFSAGTELADADFAGSPTCLDADQDSYVETCYFVTTEASLYKVRFGNATFPGDPSRGIDVVKFFDGRDAIARVHPAFQSDVNAYTRVVATFDLAGRLVLFFGSGNFESIADSTEQNYFFKVIDAYPDVQPTADVTIGVGGNNLSRTNGACRTLDYAASSFGTVTSTQSPGVLRLDPGQKILFDPVLAGGTVLFSAYEPNANQCLPGSGFLYGIRYDNCTPGIDSNGDGDLDTDRIDFTGGLTASDDQRSGFPTGPVVDEETGTVFVTLDDGRIVSSRASTNQRLDQPVLKLWWREIIQ